MKKKLFVLIIFLGLIIPVIGASAPANSISFLDVNIRAEGLAANLDEDISSAESSLPVSTPFWVDLVDAEDIANDGEGIYIAVLDTGLVSLWPFFFSEASDNIAWEYGMGYTHDVFYVGSGGNWTEEFSYGPLRDDRGFITDDFMGSGHGTHVTSTIIGWNYNNIFWCRGVAPKATIIPVLVLDAWMVPYPGGTEYFTGGTDEMVSAGIYYIADLADSLDGPVIISMSLGGPTPAPMIEEAVDYAIDKGVIIVASAGNSGDAGMGWPGAYPQVISCGMAGWTEQFTVGGWWLADVPEKLNSEDSWGNNHQLFLDYMSSRPNKDLDQKSFHLDVTTPGCAIVGPYKSYFAYNLGYYYLWGTSMAAPHVSSIAAIVLGDHPEYTQSKMEKTLKIAAAGLPLPSDGALAIDFPPDYLYYFTWGGTDYGAGFLQADAALKAAK